MGYGLFLWLNLPVVFFALHSYNSADILKKR